MLYKYIFTFSIIISIITHTAFCQNDTTAKTLHGINKTYIKSYFTDSKNIATAPFHWNKKELGIAGAVCGITYLTYLYDKEIQETTNKNQSDLIHNSSKYFFDPLGDGTLSMPLLASLYLFSNKTDDKEIALNAVKAFTLSRIFVQIPKQLFHRHRPLDDNPSNPNNWDGPTGSIEYTSFPSGHSISIFSLATVLSSSYNKKWITITSFSLATISAFSRIHENKHWASDVIFSAGAGIAIGKLISLKNNNNINLAFNTDKRNNHTIHLLISL